MSDANRREYERFSAEVLKAEVKEAGGLLTKLKKGRACIVTDLSRAGAGLLSPTGYLPGTSVLLTLETQDGIRARITGTVRFTNPVDARNYRVGVHFHRFEFGKDFNTPEAYETLCHIEERLQSL